MAELSARKYPVFKIRDLVPGLATGNEESDDVGTSQTNNPRSVGKRHQPVRISMMNFNDSPGSRNPASSRKTGNLSTRKPIRNLHKLLESPKRSVRKRLDNLYDCSKSRENVDSTIAKAQVLSSKKIPPKTPAAAAISNPRSLKKPDSSKPNENLKRSRLLPPGTITGSYINHRNSTAARTSLFKPLSNPLLIQKSSHIKRPSDVPEESLQPLEKSNDSNDPCESTKRADSKSSSNSGNKTSSVNDVCKKKETPTRCCDCSRVIVTPDATNTASKSLNGSINGSKNAKDIAKQDSDVKEEEEKFQRPTVIVMQKEATLPLKEAGLDVSLIIPVHEGTYSDMLGLRPSMNSTETDESMLFRNIETTCFQSDKTVRTDQDNEMRGYICQWISMNNRALIAQQKHLTESIAQHEKSITSLKLMLEDVNSLLNMQETMRSNFKSKGWSNLSEAELSLIPRFDDKRVSNKSDAEENCKSNSRKNKKYLQEIPLPDAASNKSNTGKSANQKPQLKDDDIDVAKGKPNTDEDEMENIENETPTRRRSARLATKKANLSLFSDQNTPSKEENKSKAPTAKSRSSTPSMTTPARGGRWGRRSERPLREYMVLKSAIKCLNTPDSKRYRIGPSGKVEIRDSLSKTDPGEALTDRLLMELHELYAATP